MPMPMTTPMPDSLRARRNADLTKALRGVPDTPHPEDEPDRTWRWLAALFGAVLLVGAGVGYLALSGKTAADQTVATAAQGVAVADPVLELCAKNDDVARALLAKGACGAAAQVRAEPIPGTAGTNGVDGKPGTNGIDGRDGKDGKDGVTPPCVTQPGQCQGAAGVDGKPGTDGVNGQDGKDGKDGRDGTDGANGKPPAGMTIVGPDGQAQTCTRDAGSPDDAATYTCTSSTGPTSMRLTSMEKGL